MKTNVITSILMSIILVSCANEDIFNHESSNVGQDSKAVLRTKSEAIQLALNTLNDFDGQTHIMSRSSDDAEVDMYSYGEKSALVDSSTVYVVNFKEGGYALVSANPELTSTLGFSGI